MTKKFFPIIEEIFLRKYPWRIHFFYETLESDDIRNLLNFIFSPAILQHGPHIREYENTFKSLLSTDGYCFSFGTGRMALYAILEALHINRGDEVILPAFTCEVVIRALLYRGIKPVYADIEPYTYNIDPTKIKKLITSKTKAIIAQHTFGVPCEIEELIDIANRYKLFVIEDCALALGSFYKGRPVGTYGHASFFSTDRTKILSTLWGGMAFTRDSTIAKRIQSVYDKSPFLPSKVIFNIALQIFLSYIFFSPFSYPIGRYLMAAGYKTGFLFNHKDNKTNFEIPPYYPCKLSNFQAAMGLIQLKKLSEILQRRKEMVKNYIKILYEQGIYINHKCKPEEITLRFSLLLKNREEFVKRWERYFEVGRWFDSPAQGWYGDLEKIGYIKGSCPVAEFVHKHIVNFPTYQTSSISRSFLYKIIKSIKPEDIAVYNEKD